MTYENGDFGLMTLVKWAVVGIVALFALKLMLGVLGGVFGLAIAVLFTIGPILLLGWLTLKAVAWLRGPSGDVV